MKILIVDDEIDIVDSVADLLVSFNYEIEKAYCGETACNFLLSYTFDLIILDWGLPDLSGIEVLKRFRSSGGVTPVLVLTGKTHPEEKAFGLDCGADDFLSKPFHLAELASRVRALLRRPREVLISEVITLGAIQLDCDAREVRKGGEILHLQPRDFQLLEYLMRHPNKFLSQESLLNRVWTADGTGTSEALRSAIKRIRRALSDDDCKIIESKQRHGYRFNA